MSNPHMDGEQVLGMFKSHEQRIILSKKYLNKHKSREVEVLLHEILHGIYYNINAFRLVNPSTTKSDLEEVIVDSTAVGLVALFKDNPELIDYIKDRLHG